MKKIILGLLFVIGANASDKCTSLAKTAEAVMKVRQDGVSYRKVIAIKSDDENLNKVMKPIIDLAYEKPRFSGEEYKRQSVIDFGDLVYKECMKGIKK